MTTTYEALRDHIMYVADSLQNFTNEVNEHGECRDENGSPTSLTTWLQDCLDIDLTVGLKGGGGLFFKSCTVTVAIGVPGIWIDTAMHEVRGVWGGSRCCAYLPAAVCEEIDSLVYELLAAPRGIAWNGYLRGGERHE